MPELVSIRVNGRSLRVASTVTVAAAIAISGVDAFRTSVIGEPRAPLCGMGICFECRVTIDGRTDSRSCHIVAREGMVIQTS